MTKTLVTAIVVAVLTVSAEQADAHRRRASDETISHRDPKDVENKLDISWVAFHGKGDGRATLVIKTRRKWGCNYISGSALEDGSVASMRWIVDFNRDPYNEREGIFQCGEGKWWLSWRQGKRMFRVYRPNRQTLKVTLPLDDLSLDRKRHLSFTAVSFANGVFDGQVHVDEGDGSPHLTPLANEHD